MTPDVDCFLRPLHIEVAEAHALSREFCQTFRHLAANSLNQFLPTPISESLLRPANGRVAGRGGTNLRAGFIELLGDEGDAEANGLEANPKTANSQSSPRLRRLLEKSWPIAEHLKNENADSLFTWIGSRIAEVVQEGCETFNLPRDRPLPMGVTFSFPMKQETLADAIIMPMGKGYAITTSLDLVEHLVNGYEKSKHSDLPPIEIAAILNDAVATLVSFIYQSKENETRKAAMGLICGTGSNATVPLRRSYLPKEKQPGKVKVMERDSTDDIKIAVNTEWSINGTAPALRKLGLITKWDAALDASLDAETHVPGFQPLEYMTAGRYLGELGRLMLLDYLEHHLNIPRDSFPSQLLVRFGLTTTFLSHFHPLDTAVLLQKLEAEFPQPTAKAPFQWTGEIAEVLYQFAKAIEYRAAAIIAAATIGLLECAGDIPTRQPLQDRTNGSADSPKRGENVDLIVGYTGGCIVHFQDYLADCQALLDAIIQAEFGEDAPVRVILSPCHDGGITGAGILCGAAQAKSKDPESGGETPRGGDGPAGPATERTALLGAGARLRPEPVIAAQEEGDDADDDYDDDDDTDQDEEDLLLVRTSSGVSGLAPESIESAMLRGRRRSRSNVRRASSTRRHGSGHEVAASATNGHAHVNGDVEANTHVHGRSFLIDTDRRRFWIVFTGIMATYFIACFDGTIMASSHPVITSYFRSSNSASWLSTAFLLTSTAFQPVVGRLSDAVGRRAPYVAAVAVFAVATVWCALAGSMASFILARAFCGLGAGAMMGLGSIIISDLVPIERRGTYQSYINVVYGLASASGAALGGLMADTLGWRWEFGVQVVPILLCLTTGAAVIPPDLGVQTKRQTLVEAMKTFDFGGSSLLIASVTFLILGLNLGGNVLPWSHPFIIASLVIFGVCFPACLYAESRHDKPIMPLALLHSAPRANLIFSNFIASFLLNAILFNVPLFFQAVLLTSATTSGLYLVVPTVTASITGTMTGFLISWTGRLKWPLTLGTALFLAGTAVLAGMRRGWPTFAYLLCLVPSSMGQGFQFPGTFMAVLAASAYAEQAVVTSTLVLWRALGSVLGVAASSLVLQNALRRYLWAYVDVGGHDDAWKAALIDRVRESVEAVARLPDGATKDQVVLSYEAAVRVTFLCCVGFALVSTLLIIPVKLPRLGARK
ncbi:MFS general substrate transporter [Xylariaceae sp. FL0662B]|nr:MFS general substrate transporter [Xylariaceae sp. FL0662B]